MERELEHIILLGGVADGRTDYVAPGLPFLEVAEVPKVAIRTTIGPKPAPLFTQTSTMYRRTGESRGGYAVFRPAGGTLKLVGSLEPIAAIATGECVMPRKRLGIRS